MTNGNELKNRKKLFELMTKNPDLPIVPLVDSEIIADGARLVGRLGNSYIKDCLIGEDAGGDKKIYFREKNDPWAEAERLASEWLGYKEYISMSSKEILAYYSARPWKKAIIIDIDLP